MKGYEEMSETKIVSIDAGNGMTNAVLAQKNGKHKSIYFASVRAAATGDSLGLGNQFEMQYEYVDWNKHRYVFGDDVLRVSRKGIERHQGHNRYGNEFHQFLVAVALSQLKMKKAAIDLTLFAPPSLFTKTKQDIQERFAERDGIFEIQFKSDKKERHFQIENVTVYPEGIGAAACFLLDENGDVVDCDTLNGEVLILDSGMYTLDILHMSNGNFNPETLGHATWENEGIKSHILEPVLRQVKKAGTEFSLLTTDDIDCVLRQGITTGDYTLRVAGQAVDLEAAFDNAAHRYSDWISNNILDGHFDGLRGYKHIILVGGGTPLIQQYLENLYGNKVLDVSKHPATKNINPIEMNAVGGLRLARMRLKQGHTTKQKA